MYSFKKTYIKWSKRKGHKLPCSVYLWEECEAMYRKDVSSICILSFLKIEDEGNIAKY